MSRRAHKQSSVSLFPFLAVLLCAMGALIFLLVITTRMIHSEALQRQQETDDPLALPSTAFGRPQTLPGSAIARNQPAPLIAPKPVFVKRDLPPPPPDLTAQLRTLREELERLNGMQQQGINEAQRLVARLAKLRKESERKQSALARAETTMGEMQSQQAANARTIERARKRSLALSQTLQDARRELARKQENLQRTDGASRIVAYDSRNGTTRRPILIECRSDRLVFRPEGIELTERDLMGFSYVSNPLQAGVSALSNYWSHVDGAVTEKDRPYVLLIVRPDGIAGFYAARRLLQSYDQPYGYELIPADEKLTYAAPDKSAVTVCRAAIDHLLKERGEVPEGLAASPFPKVERSAHGGLGSRRRGGSGNGHSSSLKPGRYEFRRTARGMELVRIDDPADKFLRPNVRPPMAARRRPEPKQNFDGGAKQNFDGNPKQNLDSERRLPLAEAAREAQVLHGGAPRLEEGTNPHLIVPGQNGNGTGQTHTWVGENGRGTGQSGRGTVERDNWTGQFDEPAPAVSVEERQEKGLTADEDRFLSELGIRENYPQPTLTEDELAALRQNVAGQRGVAGQGGIASQGGVASQGGGVTSGDPFAPLVPNAQSGVAGTPGGFPTGSSRHIAFAREINVWVGPDSVRVDGEEPIAITPGVSSDELLAETLRTMRHHVGDWGAAPKDFYWKPQVRFIVSPGGLQYYERLQPYFQQRKLLTDVAFPIATEPDNVDIPTLTRSPEQERASRYLR